MYIMLRMRKENYLL